MDAWAAIDELAGGALRGNEERARQLLNEAAPTLGLLAMRRTKVGWIKRRCLRVEVGQDCLERVWYYRETYEGAARSQFLRWFVSICNRRTISLWRRSRRDPTRDAMAPDAELEERAPDTTSALDSDTRAALIACLEELRARIPGAYDVVYLFFYTSAPSREIGEILGCPRSTIYERRARGLAAMNECLEKKGVGPTL